MAHCYYTEILNVLFQNYEVHQLKLLTTIRVGCELGALKSDNDPSSSYSVLKDKTLTDIVNEGSAFDVVNFTQYRSDADP